jgi:chaperonin cofactor prefoldin
MSDNKLTKKYIGTDQVGSSQVELENDSALRAKSADGLSTQEILKIDPSNLLQLLQNPYLPSAAVEAAQAVRKQELDSAVSSLEAQISAIQSVVEVPDFASLPVDGELDTIYITTDDNKIYRYDEGQPTPIPMPVEPSAPVLVPTISITSADDLQATINGASDGDVIFLANGTYSLAANLAISKQVALVGESQAGVLIQDTRGNAQSFVNVSVNNVTLKDLTIRHATTESSIGHAITASGGGFPQVRLNNFRMYNVKSQYSKGGLSVRSDNFIVQGCTFEIVAGSSTRRGILHYGNGGDSFIKDNLFINASGAVLRAICPTSTSGSNPSDNQSGSLTIQGSTFSGILSQFVNMDNHQGSAGAFELIIRDNITPETNAFVVSFGGIANFGDLFSRIIMMNNTLTNNHSSGLGKGAFAIDAASSMSFRSSILPLYSSGNVLGQLGFRAGYAEAAGSIGSIAGYNTVVVSPQPVVDLLSPLSPAVPEYVELSPTDLTPIEEQIASLDERLDILEPKVSTLESEMDAVQLEVISLDGRLDTLEPKVSTLESEMDAVQLEVISLDGRLDTAESNITTLQGQMTTAISDINALEAFDYAQTIYVAKSGDDSTGDGSQHNPFLTISAAMAAITDNSPSKRYGILIQSGAYTEASVVLKPNVFLIGVSRDAVRVTGAVSLDASFTGSADNRSGANEVTFLSAANFDWSEVTSAAGKLFFSRCQFSGTFTMYGYNNAIAQAQIDNCTFFGAITVSGINVGIFADNICFGNIQLNQHPLGGMATIFNITGGYCSGAVSLITTANDFTRRCAIFAKSFYMNSITVDGPSSYADMTDSSIPSAGPTVLNGGNVVYLNPRDANRTLSNLEYPTAVNNPIMPAISSSTNLGDWGKQWFFNFAYVHASSGSDMYLTSVDSSYDPAGSNTGYNVFVESDGYGLKSNVNGGNIQITTAVASGTGIRGKITLSSRIVEINSQLDMKANKIVDLADPTLAQDAATKAYVDSKVASGTDYEVQKITLSATDITNQYVDLSFKAALGSVISSSDRVNLIIVLGADSDADFIQDNSGAITRLTFQGDSATGGSSPLADGQIIYFNYVKA